MGDNVKTAGILYGALIVLNAVFAQLAVELGAGRVPLPAGLVWLVPIVVAGLTSLTMLLPRLTDSGDNGAA